MAELGEVLDGIAATVTSALYDSNENAVTGVAVTIGVGFPDSDELDNTLNAGNTFVGIFPQDGERSIVDWPMEPQELPRTTPGFSVTYDALSCVASITGVALQLDVAGVQTAGNAYNLGIVAGDTPPTIATKIAQHVPGAVAAGNTALLAYSADTLFRVDSNGATLTPIVFRERQIQINIWSASQADRDTVTQAIVAAISVAQFIVLTTHGGLAQEAVKVNYSAGTWSDRPQLGGGYMQSVVVKAGFHGTTLQLTPTILFVSTSDNGQLSLPLLNP